jgi:hypothetical protein
MLYIETPVTEIHFFLGGGAKPPKFPTKPSNFRQTLQFTLEKAVLALFKVNISEISSNFRKGGGGGGSQ